MMILPLIVLEMFKTQDKTPDAGKILVRALASIFMLISFKETINLIASIGDGIAERIDGLAKMPEILQVFTDNFNREAPALYNVVLFGLLWNFCHGSINSFLLVSSICLRSLNDHLLHIFTSGLQVLM